MPNESGTDLDALLAEAEGAAGGPGGVNGNGAAPHQDPPETPSALSGEIDVPRVGKVKIADLVAAHGRQRALQQQLARYEKHKDLYEAIEKDPERKAEILQAIQEQEAEASRAPRGQEIDDDGRVKEPDTALLDKNPVEFFKQKDAYRAQQVHDLELKYARREQMAEEKELRAKHKLDDKQFREVIGVSLRYRDSSGEPIPLETAMHIWKAPQHEKELSDLRAQNNLRSSGIPGGKISGIMSRKKIEDMNETERESAMLDTYYQHPAGK